MPSKVSDKVKRNSQANICPMRENSTLSIHSALTAGDSLEYPVTFRVCIRDFITALLKVNLSVSGPLYL